PLTSFSAHYPSPPALSTLSLHDALPICPGRLHHPHRGRHCPHRGDRHPPARPGGCGRRGRGGLLLAERQRRDDRRLLDRGVGYLDRKSTRLNSSHVSISYAVFCLKKKKK